MATIIMEEDVALNVEGGQILDVEEAEGEGTLCMVVEVEALTEDGIMALLPVEEAAMVALLPVEEVDMVALLQAEEVVGDLATVLLVEEEASVLLEVEVAAPVLLEVEEIFMAVEADDMEVGGGMVEEEDSNFSITFPIKSAYIYKLE